MSSNKDLRKANKAKKDEFYTQLVDIEKEMKHYKEQFKNKTIFCNCDDPFESNFFKYFAMNFNYLGLKKLIATCYIDSPISGKQLSLLDICSLKEKKLKKHPYKIEIIEVKDENNDDSIGISDVEYLIKNNNSNTLTLLNGDGDFRSEESLKLIKESDIIVTNPPFSLFREYIAQLIEYDKKFIIIGNINAITYKEVFKLIKDNKVWLGVSIHGGDREFRVPDNYPLTAASSRIDQEGNKYVRVKGVRWFTNLDYKERHEDLILYRKYNENDYPKYDNYNAINVDKTSEIPIDYEGYMGVPITFMDKYNPNQFEVLGIMNTGEENKGIRYKNTCHGRPIVNGVEKYLRVLIQKKK